MSNGKPNAPEHPISKLKLVWFYTKGNTVIVNYSVIIYSMADNVKIYNNIIHLISRLIKVDINFDTKYFARNPLLRTMKRSKLSIS